MIIAAVAGRLPLPTLLSQTLVAFTIEFDNESEHRLPHRTTRSSSTAGSRHAPWLVSLVMWSNCMRFVSESGISVRELEQLAHTSTNLDGMRRWGYITIETGPTGGRKRPRLDWVVRATPAGVEAQEVWRPLVEVVEQRWQKRFGANQVVELRQALSEVACQIDSGLPDCLPILGHGLFSKGPKPSVAGPAGRSDSDLSLPALLSRALLAFALEFERDSDVSLAIGANLLRPLDERGVRVRDLPLLTGVSKEGLSMAMGILQRRRLALAGPDPDSSRFKIVRLTANGRAAQHAYHRVLALIEQRWQSRFGERTLQALRESLERLVGDATADRSPLFLGLEPYPDGWRASVRKPTMLPHYPMILHRGGFPDGS